MTPQYLRGREFVLALEDERELCRILRSKAPGIRFVRDLTHDEKYGAAKPVVNVSEDIEDIGGQSARMFFVDDKWQYELKRERIHLSDYLVWTETAETRTWPNGYWRGLGNGAKIRRHRLPSGKTYECMSGGEIVFRARKSKPDELKMIQGLLRQIGKVARNHVRQIELSEPAIPSQDIRGGRVEWIGHHAAAWARAAPDRYLACNHLGNGRVFGYRPLD